MACYPVVYLIAESIVRGADTRDDRATDQNRVHLSFVPAPSFRSHASFGMWNDIPLGVIAGVGLMAILKACAGVTWG